MLGRPTALTLTLSQGGRGPRRGFTLVELLTVIVILGILAGLISAAVLAAMGKAKRAVVTLEINGLEAAARMFKEKYGDYPPDNMGDAQTVDAFLRRAFPRYRASGGSTPHYDRFLNEISPYGLNAASDSATLLVFWLGGVRDPNKPGWSPDGFSLDPENPFFNRNHALGQQRTEPLFEFKPERIQLANSNYRYYPEISGAYPSSNGAGCPYVYLRARNKAYPTFTSVFPGTADEKAVYSYAKGANEWYNPSTFQIISAGFDNNYGDGQPTGGDLDNLTNFAEGKLEDLLP